MVREGLLGILLLAAAVASCSSQTPGPGGTTPPGSYVVWRATGLDTKPPTLGFQVPGQPAKGRSVADPVYHTTIRRVTDRSADGYSAPGIQNEYSRADPENADGTRALLRGTDGTWYLYDTGNNSMLGTVDFRGNADPEPRWHPTNPNLVRFVEGPSLWQRDMGSGTDTLLHDFSRDEPRCGIVRTRYEGEPSADGRRWCLRLETAEYELISVVCYDLEGDRLLGILPTPPADNDHVTMALSGSRCVVPSDGGASYSYAPDFTSPVRLPDGIGHADVGYDTSGRDVLVYQNTRDDTIAMVDLATGVNTPLVSIPFGDNPDIGLHISCNANGPRGWALVSTYGSTVAARSWMDRCLFMLQLQPNPLVWRVAQTHTLQSADEPDYFGEAFAALNGRGTRVWWGSNWNRIGEPGAGYEAYVAELGDDWVEAVTRAGQ